MAKKKGTTKGNIIELGPLKRKEWQKNQQIIGGSDRSLSEVGGSIVDSPGNLWDDVTGKTASDKADDAKTRAMGDATRSVERMFDKSQATQKPWLEAGARGLAGLEAGINSGRFATQNRQYNAPDAFQYGEFQEGDPYQAQQYDAPDAYQDTEFKFDFEADPGYQFRLKQGQNAIEGSAAARGGLFSGAAGRQLQDYTQGLASQEYGTAYNRARNAYTQDRTFGRNKYTQDRTFGRNIYDTDRAFDRAGYDRDRAFDRANYDTDRNMAQSQYNQDRNFGYGSFMDDFNRERSLKTDDYNRLASLSGVGQMTAGNVASQQMNQGGNLANLQLGQGNIDANRAMSGYNKGMDFLNNLTKFGAVAGGS